MPGSGGASAQRRKLRDRICARAGRRSLRPAFSSSVPQLGLLVILAASAIFVADKYRKGEMRLSGRLSSVFYQFAHVEGHPTRYGTGRLGGNRHQPEKWRARRSSWKSGNVFRTESQGISSHKQARGRGVCEADEGRRHDRRSAGENLLPDQAESVGLLCQGKI